MTGARPGGGRAGGPPAACRHRHGLTWAAEGLLPGEPVGDGRVPGRPWPDLGTTDGPAPTAGRSAPGGPAGADLLATAAAVGAARWVEHRLFEVVGAWTADEACAEAAALFAVLARQFAWHADLLADRLPVLATVDPDALTVAPPGWADLCHALDQPTTVLRLVGLGRVVLPRLVVGYSRWLSQAGPAEANVRRALRLVLDDERPAWTALEAMVQDHADGVEVSAAAGHQVALEGVLGSPSPGG